jgi:NAD(P)-dependent dehydrogenase (short-subunit alcohol dehydrogenase family)
MLGKVLVITGATSGIGRIAAERLAAQGARIVIVARDQRRAELTLARLRAISPDVAHRAHIANLLSLSESRQVGDRIAAEEPRIDVLINNAGSTRQYPVHARTRAWSCGDRRHGELFASGLRRHGPWSTG